MVTHLKLFAISGFIVACLVLQAFIGMTYHGGTRWPFTSYPMYSHDQNAGDRLDDYTVTAHFTDGDTQMLDPDRLGLSFWIMRKNYIRPIIRGDFDTEGDGALRLICDTYGTGIDRLEVFDIGVSVGKQGAVYGEPALIASRDVSCPA